MRRSHSYPVVGLLIVIAIAIGIRGGYLADIADGPHPGEPSNDATPDAGRSSAALLREAKQHLERGDAGTALRLLERAHRLGNAKGAFEIGELYYRGETLEPDLLQARQWFERAARAGLRLGLYRYAQVLEAGDGGPADPDQARLYYEKAFAAGVGQAARALGDMHRDHDLAAAHAWYQKGAQTGDRGSLYRLGQLHVEGQGVPADSATALAYFERSADLGMVLAQHRLGEMFRDGDGVPRNPDRARAYFALAANGGHPPAIAALARLKAVP